LLETNYPPLFETNSVADDANSCFSCSSDQLINVTSKVPEQDLSKAVDKIMHSMSLSFLFEA